MISYLRYWWFKIGIKAGWITDSYCATHDGGYEYMSEEDRQEMEEGGLNAKGRASYKGGTLKAPVKAGDNPRRASFLARMGGMPGPERKPNGEPTRLLLSLQAWGASSKADAKKKAAAISSRNKKK